MAASDRQGNRKVGFLYRRARFAAGWISLAFCVKEMHKEIKVNIRSACDGFLYARGKGAADGKGERDEDRLCPRIDDGAESEPQHDALKAAGCGKIIEDKASGGKVKRDGLERVRETLRRGECWRCGGSTGWGGRSST